MNKMSNQRGTRTRNRNYELEQHIGKRIAQFRHARNLSLEQVAEAIHVSYQQMQKYEKGMNRVSASTLFQIASFFRVSVDQFYEGYLLPNQTQKPSASEMSIEGIKVMNEVNKIAGTSSRQKAIKHIIPVIKAFQCYYHDRATQKRCQEMLEEGGQE